MSRLSRLPMLARLAKRYALRHKGQTIRALLGLLVATIVLATGLGMGESIGVSLERAALAQYGPIDVIVSSGMPFEEGLVQRIAGDADVRRLGASGTGSLSLVGAVVNEGKGLAESAASLRGVAPGEAATLGALPAVGGGTVREPRSGEVVLSEDLAERLEAGVGDRVVLHAPRPGGPEDAIEFVNATGLANAPGAAGTHAFTVREGAFGAGAVVIWLPVLQPGTVTVELTAPSGVRYANASQQLPLILFVDPPVEAGRWTARVTAERTIPYNISMGAAYLPEDIFGAGAARIEATVAGIAAEEGRVGVTFRPTAIVPLADLQRAVGAEGQVNRALFTVQGDARAAVEAINATLGDDAGEFQVSAAKLEAIDEAAEAGAEITGFLLVMGGFTLLASVMLAFTLFSALVEERRAELGIARALGLTRGEVALSMTIEGGLYAGAAALVGLLVGLALVLAAMAGINYFAEPQGAPRMGFHVSPGTIAGAYLLGAFLPLLTIGIASLRFARLDPARAIRGIPDDPKTKRRTGLVMAAGLLALGTLLALGPTSRILGIPVLFGALAIGLHALRQPILGLLAAAGGIAHIGWSLYTFNAWPEGSGELDPILTLARGAVLAMGLSALAVVSAGPYLKAAAFLPRRAARSSFVALKYLVSRRRPAGLTMAMIALVVVVVTVMGTLFLTFSATIPRDEAGYQVLGESALPLDSFATGLPPDLVDAIERTEFLPRHLGFRQADVREGDRVVPIEFGMRQFLGVTDGFVEANEYALDDRDPRYADDRAAWAAVARGEALLVPQWLLDDLPGVVVGDTLTVTFPNGDVHTYVLAGGVRSQIAFQTFLAADHVRGLGFPLGSTVFVRVQEGADPDTVAHRLNAELAGSGLSFVSIPEEAARIASGAQAIILVFEAFLALGLFVGLAATGFLASRAVHERMRDIGTLRALGFEEKDVERTFLLESVLTATLGILLGLACGLVVAHSVWWREIRDQGIDFTPPWALLGVFAVSVIGLAAWASRGPARRASRLPPAIAVRHVE